MTDSGIEIQVEDASNVQPLGVYARRAYLEYAMSVVKGRALPSSCDGMKPVQRRILYSMSEMGLSSSSKPVKSARVVGDVLGKFHPHGDSACYEALVRVAQDFSLRYPLIDGQGNFGSRDGDGAAAMRYTECRLTPIASLLLSELDKGTIEFEPNYDGSFQEPSLLPSRIPMLLLNGASGIGVGLATEIPSHNIKEVAAAACMMIKNPSCTIDDILTVFHGPDFPGGGHIISSPSDIKSAYESGRGSVRVRARWSFEEMARSQWQMVISELPPGVSTAKVLEELESITNPQPRAGKKLITPEQSQAKAMMLSILDSVRDESGKDADVRIVLSPKTSKIDRDLFVGVLLSGTSLECSSSINMVAVTKSGQPGTRPLMAMLSDWVSYRFWCVRRRHSFRLDQVNSRMHILEGRRVILINIDRVISLIRSSDDPKSELIIAFGVSELQADDILEIRLKQLARLESIKIDKEIQDLEVERVRLSALLSNDSDFRGEIIKEITSDSAQFGDERRTLIEVAAKSDASVAVADEPVTITFSSKGWIKVRSGHGADPASITFKDGDSKQEVIETTSGKFVSFLTDEGRVFSVAASALPSGRGDGQPLSSILDLSAVGSSKFISMISGNQEDKFLICTSGGYGFTCQMSDLQSRNKSGKSFVAILPGESMLRPIPVDSTELRNVVLATKERILVIRVDDLRLSKSGGRGLQMISTSDQEPLIGTLLVGDQFLISGEVLKGKSTGCKEVLVRGDEFGLYVGRRGSKGRKIPGVSDGKFKLIGVGISS